MNAVWLWEPPKSFEQIFASGATVAEARLAAEPTIRRYHGEYPTYVEELIVFINTTEPEMVCYVPGAYIQDIEN